MRYSLALVSIGVLLGQSSAAGPMFSGLGDLPGGATQTIVTGVSGDGSTVVGWSFREASEGHPEAFVWTGADGMVGLGDLPDGIFQSTGNTVSADGSIVVGDASILTGTTAFMWTSGNGMVSLGDLPGGSTQSGVTGMSADGSTVVGGSGGPSGYQAYRWTSQTGMVGIVDIPAPGRFFVSYAYDVSGDGATVVGSRPLSTYERVAYRWNVGLDEIAYTLDDTVEDLGDLPGGRFFSSAVDVSHDGSVVVGKGEVGTLVVVLSEPFIWTRGTGMIGLGHLPGHNSGAPSSVSADGSTVLGSSNIYPQSIRTPWIWDANEGMRELSTYLTDRGIDLAGWTLIGGVTGGAFMSDDGNVFVGQGINPSGYTEGWIAVLDEAAWASAGSVSSVPVLPPIGVAVLAGGLGWMGVRASRRVRG